jgi:hypothetical protein
MDRRVFEPTVRLRAQLGRYENEDERDEVQDSKGIQSETHAIRHLHHSGRSRETHRAENSHLPIRRRERKIQGSKSSATAQRFRTKYAAVHNNFSIQPHINKRPHMRTLRATVGVHSCSDGKILAYVSDSDRSISTCDQTTDPRTLWIDLTRRFCRKAVSCHRQPAQLGTRNQGDQRHQKRETILRTLIVTASVACGLSTAGQAQEWQASAGIAATSE